MSWLDLLVSTPCNIADSMLPVFSISSPGTTTTTTTGNDNECLVSLEAELWLSIYEAYGWDIEPRQRWIAHIFRLPWNHPPGIFCRPPAESPSVVRGCPCFRIRMVPTSCVVVRKDQSVGRYRKKYPRKAGLCCVGSLSLGSRKDRHRCGKGNKKDKPILNGLL